MSDQVRGSLWVCAVDQAHERRACPEETGALKSCVLHTRDGLSSTGDERCCLSSLLGEVSSPPPRVAVLDTSVLTSDVIAATHRETPSSLVAGMRDGTYQGFIARHVWAEVPRVLEDRADVRAVPGVAFLPRVPGSGRASLAARRRCLGVVPSVKPTERVSDARTVDVEVSMVLRGASAAWCAW